MKILMILGVAIILALTAVAAYLHWQLYKLKQERIRLQQKQKEALQEKQKRCLNSIVVLARGMLEGQVTLTEASMRISALLEALRLPEDELEHYVAFGKLAKATSHIPVLDAWKALSRTDKARLTTEREQHEDKYQDFVYAAAKRLLSKHEDYSAHMRKLVSF